MIQFELKNLQYDGPPSVSDDGLTLSQRVAITTGVVGNTYAGKFIQHDTTVFMQSMSLSVTQIKDNIIQQAQNFISTNYPTIP